MISEEILLNGENQYVEYTEKIDNIDSITSEIVAFLNSEGGMIIIGINDSGEVVGVDDIKKAEEQITNICRFNCLPEAVPAIEFEDVRGKKVVIAHIPKGLDKPYRTINGHYYLRVGSTKRKASREELSRLFQLSGFLHYDEGPVPGSSESDIDVTLVRKYYLKVFNKNIDDLGIDIQQFFQNIKVIKAENKELYATVAGLLVFGKAPQDFLPNSRISAVRFIGNGVSSEMIDRREITGTLPELIDQAQAFIIRNIKNSTKFDGTVRKDIYEYPPEAIRELIVNAVVHRNYSISGSQIRIYIFNDRLEVRSPGRLPNTITIENIRYGNHFTRNPLIAKLMINLGYMEDIGLGIPKVYDSMKKHNNTEPKFYVRDHDFIATLISL